MAPSSRVCRVAVIAEPIRKSVYKPGEWVWCEWKKIYYKAKILERGIENDGQYYNIHYWKFSKLWDMTVSEKKMFPVVDKNNKWVKNHNKLMRKEIKETKKAREKILSLLKKRLPPKEMPPYLIIEKIDVSNYLDKRNTASSSNEVSDVKVNHDYNVAASTSREDEMIEEKHSEPINIDGNGHVNGSVSNTKASACVSFSNQDDFEMNIKCENIVGPEVDISTDAGDQNSKEVNISSFHEAESNIENKISIDSQKNTDKWFEEVQTGPRLQSDDDSSELKHCNNSVSPQCEIGSNSTENEHHDHNETDFNSTSNVKVPLNIEVEKNTYSSQNGSTQIFKRKRKDLRSAEREKKKKRKHMIINDHVDLIDGNCHIIKSSKLCSMDIINNKNNDKSIDGDDLAGKSNIDTQFGNMIGSEGDSIADNGGNELSTEEGVSLKIMNTTKIAESNNENKLIIDDSSSTSGGDLKIEEELKIEKIEKDLKIEVDLIFEKDLKLEEASTSSITVPEANYENEMIKLVIGSPEDGDLNIEESSTISVSEENDENLINISCKSSTKDDGEYADNMKIMNEVKIDDYEDNFFKQFGYDKPYSRIAKQRATEAISLMSKTVNKDKKNEGCKKPKITKKKDDDEPSNIVVLTHRNLNLNCYFLQIFIQDYHLVTDDRYMPIVPSKITVFDILSAYTKHSSADLQVFTQLIHVFDYVFESLILYPIERPKHTEIVQKRPAVLMAHMYGLPHLARFIFYLPGVLCTISYAHQFTSGAIHFMQGLTDYLEEQKMELTMDLYENTLPEYVRCSFLPYR